ncbi:MAG: GYD domain-containing protein [Acidobacteriaceae bacterium]
MSYKPETIAAFIKHPTDRREVIAKLAAQVGGKLVGSWLTLGDHDAIVIVEGPDLIGAAACSMVVSASGAFKSFKTTPLLTVDEGMAAMKKAGTLKYKPPTAKK